MRTIVYFTRELPGLSEELERNFRVYEALAISEVLYLSKEHPDAVIIVDATVDAEGAAAIAQSQMTLRLKRSANGHDVIVELSGLFPEYPVQ